MASKDDDLLEPEEELVDEVDDMRMSRTEEPDYSIKFDKVRDKVVFDPMGNEIKFGDIFKKQKTIVIFVRHFLDFITKDYVEDLGSIPLEYLQAADVRLVDFKKSTNFNYTLYCDPERELYKALNMNSVSEYGDVRHAKHVKQNAIMGIMRGMWKIMKSQEWEGDNKQNGGSFVLGPGEVVHFSHLDKNQVDQVPINEILKKADVQLVSFPKDPRVQNI
ncbi:PXL2C-like protein [Mya arenaria]|uniref:PXL2C-like protein n=1 Tax=Mya arenaria TaxID=6604 RepID=A0ABY7FPN6_MYAAR|nr:PXL2C-like protein [Mya arenaria]